MFLAFFLTSNLLISCGQLQITNNASNKLALSALQFPVKPFTIK